MSMSAALFKDWSFGALGTYSELVIVRLCRCVMLMLSDSWSFESRRYFGEQGREIMATHTISFEAKGKTFG